MKRITFILFMVICVIIVSACSSNTTDNSNNNDNTITKENQQSFPYPLVKWNNHIYKITNESIDEIDKEIGEIEYQSLNEEEDTPDNYSNYYSKGTKLFSIKGVDTNDAIAVQLGEGNYIKVVNSSSTK